MKIKPLLIIGLFALMIIASAHTSGVKAQEYNVINETRDLGWITLATSSNYTEVEIENTLQNTTPFMNMNYSSTYRFGLYNEWNITTSCGASLPVNLTVIMPKNATPGENVTITISIESLLGYVFFSLVGYHYLETEIEFENEIGFKGENATTEYIRNAFYFALELLSQYNQSWQLPLETPIGYFEQIFKNVSMHLGDFSLELEMAYEHESKNETEVSTELEVSVSAYLLFDVTIIANTTVIGTVNITGTAIDSPQTYILEWNSEGEKTIAVPVSPNAGPNSTIEPSIGLEYVVHQFEIIYSNISLALEINELEFEQEIEQKLDENMKNTTLAKNYSMLYDNLKTMLTSMLTELVMENAFGFWNVPYNVTETKPIEREHEREHEGEMGLLGSSSSNTIESKSPYTEALLLFTTTTISVITKPQGFTLERITEFLFTTTGLFVIASVIASLVIIGYIATRKNTG